ncbi:hypothetical protein D3C86_2034840 [compost metagenome]
MLIGLGQRLFECFVAQGAHGQAAPGKALGLGQRHQLDGGAMGQAGRIGLDQQDHTMTLGEAERQTAQGRFGGQCVHPG